LAKITLFEIDPLFDDQMNTTVADGEGRFIISGEQKEVSWLCPTVVATSTCDVFGDSPL
jgi:hypothetical protein